MRFNFSKLKRLCPECYRPLRFVKKEKVFFYYNDDEDEDYDDEELKQGSYLRFHYLCPHCRVKMTKAPFEGVKWDLPHELRPTIPQKNFIAYIKKLGHYPDHKIVTKNNAREFISESVKILDELEWNYEDDDYLDFIDQPF